MMEAVTALLVIVAIYLGIVLFLGYLGWKKRGVGLVDFFLAGRGMGSFLVFISFSATLFSAFTLLGMPGMFYTHGVAAWTYLAICDITMPVLFFIFGWRFWKASKEFGYVTPSEMLSDRYESHAVGVLSLLIFTIFVLPYLSIQLVGAGHLLAGSTHGLIPYSIGMLALAAVLFIYSEMGGLRSVVWTDAVQGLLLLGISFYLAFTLVFKHFGSITNFIQQVATTEPALLSLPGPTGFMTHLAVFSLAFVTFIAMPCTQFQLIFRFMMAKNVKAIKLAAIACTIFAFLVILPGLFLGIGGRLLFPGLTKPDTVVPSILGEPWIPVSIAGLGVAGIMAAAMSTADSQLLAIGSVFSKDVYVNLVNKEASIKQQMWIARASVLATLALAFLIGLRPPKHIVMLAVLSFAGTLQIFPAIVGAFFWEKATKEGAIASMVIGVIVLCLFHFIIIPNTWLPYMHPGLWGLIFGTITFIIVSLATKPPVEKAHQFTNLT